MTRASLVICGLLAMLTSSIAAAVDVKQTPGGDFQIDAKTYAARVDASGALVSLRMGDVELLGADPKTKRIGAPFPGEKPATSINLRDRLLAIRNDANRLEYTFDDTGIGIETEGAPWGCQLAAPIQAFVGDDGRVTPGTSKSLGNVTRFILKDNAFESTEPFHYVHGRLFLSAIPSNRKKPADLFSFRIEFGLSPDATALIEIRSFAGVGDHHGTAPRFSRGEPVKYAIELMNLGGKDHEVVLSYTLGTHFVGGTTTEPTTLPALSVPAGHTAQTTLEIAVADPGVHWLNLEMSSDGKTLKRERRAFVYAADEYKPPLTRPDDFTQFWQEQLKALRAEPMNATLTEIPERSSDAAAYYNLELTVRGRKYSAGLGVPRTPGKHLAMFGGKIGEKATDANRIIVSFGHENWPEHATYNRWVSAADNNLLDCYLLAVRITDYLRSRDDVDRIYLSGGSRQGPIQLANAALDPTRIAAVESHVPTSMGVSWPDYAYRGWGSVPKPPAMASYVDPVNFAADFTVPYIIDLGAYDGLSPVPGGLAFHNAAVKSPFRRFSVELGGHGYFTSPFKKAAKADLDAFLNANTAGATDDKILKEH